MPENGHSDPISRLRPSSAESGGRSTPLPGRNRGVRSKFRAHLNPWTTGKSRCFLRLFGNTSHRSRIVLFFNLFVSNKLGNHW